MENLLSLAQLVLALSVAYVWIFRYHNVVKEFIQFGLNDVTRNFVGVTKIALSTLLVAGIWYTAFVQIPAPVEAAEKVDRSNELKKQIEQILADKKALVGISISGENGNDALSINGNMHCPTQSAYKMHIGLAMHRVKA